MQVPELVFSPSTRTAELRVGSKLLVKLEEDDAGLLHVSTSPDDVTSVKHGNEKVVDNGPPDAVWQEMADARAPQLTAEDQIRAAVEAGVTAGAKQEDIVRLAAKEAARIVKDQETKGTP